MRIAAIEDAFRATDDGKAAAAGGGMVAAATPQAAAAGAAMLAAGGTAADAAAAVAFTLGVTEPQASGLGGQSIGLLRFGRRTAVLDGSSRIPRAATIASFPPGSRLRGHRGATVPTTPAALAWLHRRYGVLPWAAVLEPAIDAARHGYDMPPLQARLLAREADDLRAGARCFLDEAGAPFAPGDTFRQPALAETLETIAAQGVEAFYQGEIAARIAADMRAHGGLIGPADLDPIPWPVERAPLRRRYRRVTIETLPRPASGRTLLHVLLLLADQPRPLLDGARGHHRFAEALRKTALHRLDRPDHPTYQALPDRELLRRTRLAAVAATIGDAPDPSLPRDDPPEFAEGETTHFTVMDAAGNAVAITQSIEMVYGAKVAADGLGFLYNNYMLAVETRATGHPNFLRPGGVPWSSAAPVFALVDGDLWLALGTPGSDRILSTTAQILSHMIDGGASLDAAVRAPRLHCTLGGALHLEADRFDPELIAALDAAGYRIARREPFSFYFGGAHGVLRRRAGGGFQGAADPRRDGRALGVG